MTRLPGCRGLAVWLALIVGPWTAMVAGGPIGRGLLISSETITSDVWGASRYRVTNQYDLQGNVLETVTEYDAYNDGSVDSVDTVTNTYDSRGHLLTTTSGNSSTSYTYDEKGRETAVRSEADFDGDGVVDYVSSFSRTYDPSGNIVGGVYVSFSADGSSNLRWVFTSTFGPNGTELSSIAEGDYEDDGVIDDRYTTTSTYDSQGRVLVRESVYDHFVYEDWDYVSSETMTYDAQGNLLSQVLAQDYAANSDYWQSQSFTYDTHRRALTITTEHDYGADDVLEYRAVETRTYDSAGNVLTWTSEEDSNSDGVVDARYHVASSYDAPGHLTRQESHYELEAFEWRSLRTLTYDRTGNLTMDREEGFDGDGVPQSTTVMTNTY